LLDGNCTAVAGAGAVLTDVVLEAAAVAGFSDLTDDSASFGVFDTKGVVSVGAVTLGDGAGAGTSWVATACVERFCTRPGSLLTLGTGGAGVA